MLKRQHRWEMVRFPDLSTATIGDQGPVTRRWVVTILVGTSGWQYADWRGVLYPPGLPQSRWLERYAECFDTVENNNAFSRLPTPENFGRWREQTGEGFVMAVKASRFLTHIKRLKDP